MALLKNILVILEKQNYINIKSINYAPKKY